MGEELAPPESIHQSPTNPKRKSVWLCRAGGAALYYQHGKVSRYFRTSSSAK